MKKQKKKLTIGEEFEIMKLVLDKFLWISAALLVYGIYKVIEQQNLIASLYYFITGIVIMILFMFIIVKEYEIAR
jgi:hypothetical protein